ncbi:hypothetical protein [Serinicoccus sp. LYQ131]|uniref:hypothetical protein n=1 Tax=Serinicoccus sp. LYQ131 TaxID=3378797 RepID=UPI003852BC27
MAHGDVEYYEVWGDTASIGDLVKAVVLTVGLTMAAYLLVPGEAPVPLVAGLGGAVLGFVLSSFLIPTKRVLAAADEDADADADADADTDGGTGTGTGVRR